MKSKSNPTLNTVSSSNKSNKDSKKERRRQNKIRRLKKELLKNPNNSLVTLTLKKLENI